MIANALAALLLLCAFALLAQRRLTAMLTLLRAEALILSAAAFVQGFAQGSDGLYLTGIITISIEGVLLPLALRRSRQRCNLTGAVEPAMPPGLLLILGVMLTGIAVMAVPTRQDLAIALAVLLLGLLVMISGRHPLTQVIGFISAENGLLLAAIGMPGMPMVAALAVALLALAALLLAGVFGFRLADEMTAPGDR